ncbi:CDP-alcohol phosphatidyltransferase family protein [Candidatus Micrarchaeota archaeon]|nr:CDP-alcohol phosphatidyltransferase family protein [Candidatus Micrarchaeota archaeon]MBU1939581.1 CDP-alcohol phosphatidyltransferase family protein [Candidatus Micrarchaeota archaeon]
MLYGQRERFEKYSIKVGLLFSRAGISPNAWTLMSLIPAFIAFYFLLSSPSQNFILAALFLLIAGFLDLVDGSVARVTGRVTKFGAYLDTIVDRIIEATLAFGLLLAALPEFMLPAYAWIFLYFCGSTLTTYAKSAAKEKGLVERELRGGILERAERLVLLFTGILLAAFNPLWLVYVLVLLAIFTNITALQRIYSASKAKGAA